MGKKSILYIMGIDWAWIYQRPQILAERLSADYDVTIVFPRSILKKGTAAKPLCAKHRILWTFPYQEKNVLIGKISALYNRKIFKDIHSFDYVYIGYPQYARYISEDYEGKIIYDCMDNHEKLYPDQKRVYKVIELERQLIRRCDLLFVSAQLLADKVNEIAGCKKSILIRNGVKLNYIDSVKVPQKRETYHLGYVGTISEWFDYNIILESLKEVHQIRYHLIGPASVRVNSPGILYEGIINHDELGEAIREYDCMIMPFTVNDIVLSVDPVKLYEYIAYGKCIISVYYPEIERFNDFVYFYHTMEEYMELLQKLMDAGFPPKYTAEQQKIFLNDNTWDKRYEVLKKKIEALEGKDEN